MGYRRHTAAEYVQAIEDARGIVSVAARRLGVSRRAVQLAAKRHKKVAEALEDARENIVDVAEARLYAMINEGDPGMVKFVLRTLGKGRGYVERSEHAVDVTGRDLNEMTDDELEAIANGDTATDTR